MAIEGINQIVIVGLVGADPEVRQSANGNSVCTLRVATHYRDSTTWHRAVLFGKTAEFAGKFVNKGDIVGVTGRMDYREYTAGDGSQRFSAEIYAYQLQKLSGKNNASDGRTDAPGDIDGNVGGLDDDLPF